MRMGPRTWAACLCVVLVAVVLDVGRKAVEEHHYNLVYFFLHQDCGLPESSPRVPAEEDGSDSLATVHVAYASDAGGFSGVLPSMISLSRSLGAPQNCSIHLIVPAADLPKAEGIVECFRRELSDLPVAPTVVLHRAEERMVVNASAEQLRVHQRPDLVGPLNFARFYLHEYLPDAPRALWLDYDTIVLADVAPLYRSRMGHSVAAAPRVGLRRTLDYLYHKHPTLPRDAPGARAFNPGVLLVDLERWRSEGMARSVEGWARTLFADWAAANESEKADRAPDPTQSPLNLACAGAFDHLDWRWNVLNLGVQRVFLQRGVPPQCVREARILHWNGPEKPWRDGHHDYKHLYDRFAPRQACDALRQGSSG